MDYYWSYHVLGINQSNWKMRLIFNNLYVGIAHRGMHINSFGYLKCIKPKKMIYSKSLFIIFNQLKVQTQALKTAITQNFMVQSEYFIFQIIFIAQDFNFRFEQQFLTIHFIGYMSEDRKIEAQNQEKITKELRPLLGCAIAVILCILVPLIVLNIVMANGDSPCLTQEITKFSINMHLRTWLLVQAYILIAVAALLILACLLACISPMVGAFFGALGVCVLIPVTFFNIAWTIVGAVMFWGQLYPAKTCNNGLNIYMWIVLILGCLSICNAFFYKKQT